jgi:hypothetical protein
MMIAGISLATWAPYLLVLLFIPFAVAVWSWRSGTDVDTDGLTVGAAVGRRRIPWSDVDGLVADERGRVSAHLSTGGAVPLPVVRAEDLPKIVAAAGQEPKTDAK